mmetsp:Transcript_130272/g.324829  ORF Transcript_130272/g.324829 Transcript_130272/m.324829 type:complete len:212 (-) Transcript_130272:536-1171(-)
MVVALAAEGRPHHRPCLGACIPQDDSAGVGPSVNERRLKAMKVCREHAAWRGEDHLRPAPHGQVPDEHAAVQIGSWPWRPPTVRGQEQLAAVRTESRVHHGPAADQPVLDVIVDVSEQVLVEHDGFLVEPFIRTPPVLLAKCALDQQCGLLEKSLEVRAVLDWLARLQLGCFHLSSSEPGLQTVHLIDCLIIVRAFVPILFVVLRGRPRLC